jgi:hypothetical protein
MKKKGDLQRFWEKVSTVSNGPDGCWEWKAGHMGDGYGSFRHPSSPLAHRVAWVLSGREIPEGMCLLHKCDNPNCVNPKHLFLGTRADNNRDRQAKGRSAVGTRHGIYTHRENSRTRLGWEKASEIRRLFESERMTHKELAARFGVYSSLITRVLQKKIWWKEEDRDGQTNHSKGT